MAEVAGESAKRKSWALPIALWVALAGVLVAFIGLAPSCSRPVAGGELQRLATGPMARFAVTADDARLTPDTVLTNLAGAQVRLADYRGDVLVVNLWATWCAPCVEEMPTLAALHQAFAGRGAQVVAVSVDADPVESAKTLAKLSGGVLPFHHDTGARFAFDVGAQGFPTTIVYARDGRELGRLAGAADWASPEAKALVEAALAR